MNPLYLAGNTQESFAISSTDAQSSALAQLGALGNAPVITNASGVGAFPWGAIRVGGNSIITTVVGVGSTTGTWKHYIRYEPLEEGATITPAF